MILPGSFLFSLLVLIFGLLAASAWPNTLKAALTRKLRFELYYYDFAFGFLAAALLAAFTLGSMGADGFSFVDDFLLAGKKQDAFGMLAGLCFNLGNMLFAAAIAVSGITPAAPVALGVALALDGLMLPLMGHPTVFLTRLGGATAVLAAVVMGIIASRRWALARLDEAIRTGRTKSTKRVVSPKAAILAIFAGLFLGLSVPLMQLGRDSEIALGPYSFSFVFALGVVISTLIFNLFFMNMPVQGKPAELTDYFRSKGSAHIVGLVGGAVALSGLLATQLALRADGPAQLDPRLSYPIANGAAVVTMLFGVVFWKELEGTDSRVNTPLAATLVMLLLGLGLLAFAHLPAAAAR